MAKYKTLKDEIAENIRALARCLNAKGRTDEEIANSTGLTIPQVHKVLNGGK
jgi:transcription initiation factor IIE alpha subunit